MTRVLAALLLVAEAASIAGQPSQSFDGLTLPYEDVGACPGGEGCPGYGQQRARRRMVAYAGGPERYPRPPYKRAFVIAPGEPLNALTGVAVTVRPTVVVVRRPLDTGFPGTGGMVLQPGETVYLLTSRGELYWSAWVRGRLRDDVRMPGLCERSQSNVATCRAEITDPGKREWWVYVENARGRRGWLKNPAFEMMRGDEGAG